MIVCADCGSQVGEGINACPQCHRLVHQEKLKELAVRASSAGEGGRLTEEITLWREALELLPEGSKQAGVVTAKIATLRDRIDAGETDRPAESAGPGRRPGMASGLGLIGVLAWKFKFAFVFFVTKAKFLFAGLSNLPTLLSMLVYMQRDWNEFGWKFGLGFVLSIYLHEMGHVAAITRYGMQASAPMFIPGLGALIRLSSRPVDPIEDSAIGLAGPKWGLGTAVACWLTALATGSGLFGAIARAGALINLFNLIPLGPLDGGRGFNALSFPQRLLVVLTCFASIPFTEQRMAALVGCVGVYRLISDRGHPGGSWRRCAEFLGLVVALTALVEGAR